MSKLASLLLCAFALGLDIPVAAEPLAVHSGKQSESLSAPDYGALLEQLDAAGSAVHEPTGVTISDGAYQVSPQPSVDPAKHVEAVLFTPAGEGPWPALLLIPGYGRSARDWADNGITFASAGYLCLAVSQPGMGGSEGPADFVGPWTMAVLDAGLSKLKSLPQANPQRLGVVGFSRGAMAASLLATRRDDIRAVVCGGGIYDLEAAFSEISSQMIRRNMLLETGSWDPTAPDQLVSPGGPQNNGWQWKLDPQAARERSSIHDMDKLTAKLLILHGEADINAPASQAHDLRERLLELGKVETQVMDYFLPPGPTERRAIADFMLLTFPDTAHGIGRENFQGNTLEFLKRVLQG